MAKSTSMLTLLAVVLCLGTILEGCSAFSVQPNGRGVDLGCQGKRLPAVSCTGFHQKLVLGDSNSESTLLFNTRLSTALSVALDGNQSLPRSILQRFHGKQTTVADISSNSEIHNQHNNNLLHSFAVVAAGRRIAFLFLSATLVNFVRSTVLKASVISCIRVGNIIFFSHLKLHTKMQIPKSDKKMFDECPWPFTLFHDPIKFIKAGATHVVVLWAVLCQLYSRFQKARAIIP